MIQIRRSVFETNSSSTHSLCITSEKQFNDWKNGKLLYNRWDERFVCVPQITDEIIEKACKKYEENKTKYMKSWGELDNEARDELIMDIFSKIKSHYIKEYAFKTKTAALKAFKSICECDKAETARGFWISTSEVIAV